LSVPKRQLRVAANRYMQPIRIIAINICVSILVLSCNDQPTTSTSSDSRNYQDYSNDTASLVSQDTTNVKPSEKRDFSYYMDNNLYLHWAPNHSDTSRYMCEIAFHEEYLVYWMHGQCAYYFFTAKTSDSTADMYWSYKPDCILDMRFLEQTHGVSKMPTVGSIFATYTLESETTISVKYEYPLWVEKINEIANDSLFPVKFSLVNDGSI